MAKEVDIAGLLQTATLYPVPREVAEMYARRRGLDPSALHATTPLGRAFNLAQADVYMWLSAAPDVAQGGQHFSFSDEDKRELREAAQRIYTQYKDEKAVGTPYGYKGESL